MKFVNKKLKIGVSVLAIFLILGFIVPLFGPENPTEWGAYLKNMPPSSEHLLGTTSLGQDTFFLLAHSINNSFKIGIAVSLIATAAGVFLGLIAGFKSGLIDRLISLLTDSFIVIPSLPILILLSSFLKGTASVSFIVAILALFSWPLPARQVRSMALSLRERESISMALFSGESMIEWGAYLKNMPPSSEHLLGTTSLGQDTFFLLAHSINNSFKIGIAVSLIATAAGVFLGLIAGFKSGLIDRLISLLTDSFIVIPSLPILILLSSFLKGTASVSFIVAILALFSWPLPARQVRSMALSLRERESISMALFSGESMIKIIVREIFPYISGWTLANFVNGILAAIAAESTLAVIGMSSNSTATLGTMIYWANQYQAMLGGRWLWIGTPVVATVIIFISLFLTMNGYQEYMAKRRGKNA